MFPALQYTHHHSESYTFARQDVLRSHTIDKYPSVKPFKSVDLCRYPQLIFTDVNIKFYIQISASLQIFMGIYICGHGYPWIIFADLDTSFVSALGFTFLMQHGVPFHGFIVGNSTPLTPAILHLQIPNSMCSSLCYIKQPILPQPR